MANDVPTGDRAVFAFFEMVALAFAFEGVAIHARHKKSVRIHAGGNLKLGLSSLPVAGHTGELEEKDAQLRIRRVRAHLVYELLMCSVEVALT